MSEVDARARFHGDEAKSKLQDMIRSTAFHLRSLIHAIPKWKTPTPTSVHTLKTCSPELPEDLLLFYKTPMCGLREPTGDKHCQGIQRKVLSMSSDAVFNASKSTVRPWKQTALGLGIGTLTGSKLILGMLNRLGCCLSYGDVKALETEFAFTANEDNRDTPSGLGLDPNLGTGLAWDNYDVNMETLDGKDTLHATVGTCYQNKTEDEEMAYCDA